METKFINSIEELITILNSFENHYIFRGQSHETWELKSSLERTLGDKYREKAEVFEKYAIREFKTKFELYNTNDYQPQTMLEWLAMMQHYGTPTSLLDFSESPYIALYFALENADKLQEENLVIYALDYRMINLNTIEEYKKLDTQFTLNYSDIEDEKDKIFEEFIERFNLSVLWVTEPQKLNKRIERQRGSFLYKTDISKTYEEILYSELYKNVDFHKLVLPARLWDNYFTLLNKMNINGKTVYGDLDGLSKQIKMFIQAYS